MPRFCFIYKNYFSVFYNNIVKNDFWPIWESCSNLFTNSCFFTEIFLLSVIFIFIFKITNCDLKRIVILRTKVVLLAYKPLLHKPFLWKERKINSIIAMIVLLVIASLVVRYLPLNHSTLPHPEWNTPCGANLLLPYIRFSSVLPFLQSLPCVRVFHLSLYTVSFLNAIGMRYYHVPIAHRSKAWLSLSGQRGTDFLHRPII